MLPLWLISLPVWLVVFIVVYAAAILYVAIKYREVRKFLAGAFFVSSGMLCYFWATNTSIPVVLPYVGSISVETPDISGQRAAVHFILFLLCFYFGFLARGRKSARTDRSDSTDHVLSHGRLVRDTSSSIPIVKWFLGDGKAKFSKTALAMAGVNSFDDKP